MLRPLVVVVVGRGGTGGGGLPARRALPTVATDAWLALLQALQAPLGLEVVPYDPSAATTAVRWRRSNDVRRRRSAPCKGDGWDELAPL